MNRDWISQRITDPRSRGFELPGGPTGALLLHGFTATAALVRPVGEALSERGCQVVAPLLPGHGQSLKDMNRSDRQAWWACAQENYQRLADRCQRVIVVGHSMGGLLALLLAERFEPAALVTLAAAVRLRAPVTPALARLAARVKPYRRWGDSRPAEPGCDTDNDINYTGMPMAKVADLLELSRAARRELDRITCPLLMVQGRRDETVNPDSGRIILDGAVNAAQRRALWLPEAYHNLTCGPFRHEVIAEVTDFLSSLGLMATH
ncbi:MAG: alpha/beta hydrolase [Christensenellales bacterium]|jgi:carboxylesterase